MTHKERKILPDDKAMTRVYNLGVIDHLINASQNGATVKIICPLSKENSDIVKKMSDNASNIRILNSNTSSTGMLIIDNTKFFRAELKAPNADEFIEAIGFPIYSNSKPSVESFRSIFELLWNERALNEELKNTQTMQKEFIDMAAHELRTPIQPILSLSAVLQSKEEGNIKQYRELLDVINRSAKKLQKLTEDILDVSRIESQTLKLTKNQFNLKELILYTLTDYKAELKTGKDNKINLEFISNEKEDTFFVHADQGRITQVFSNLLSNAVKFTEEGSIVVKMKREKCNNTNSHEQVVVSIQDTGKGIDPAVRNKLFEKFETKSEKGIGLGLYISRRIIEAHAGRIWAENNADSKGATFSFSLPLSKL
jgi:signal transduction histidine kinase